jgi:hypothetical protein
VDRLKDTEEKCGLKLQDFEKSMEATLTKYKANMENQYVQFWLTIELYQSRDIYIYIYYNRGNYLLPS